MEKHLQTPEQRALFVEGIKQYLHLMEIYWDGIARKLGKGLPA
jgi:pyrroloquinoline-quinone synthase